MKARSTRNEGRVRALERVARGGAPRYHAKNAETGKLFAGLYALYCGIAFIASAGILFAPILHRLLHRFHWMDAGADR